MKPFVTAENRAQVVAVADAWTGTPFVLRARVKGSGVDCVNLGAGIMEDAGFPGAFTELPLYRVDSGTHADRSALIDWFRARSDFKEVCAPFEVGDMMCFRVGRHPHHMGMFVGGEEFVHALVGSRVKRSSVRDVTWSKRLVAVFRPMV